MQNRDGGWAAYTRGITRSMFEFKLKELAPISFFYDFSSPDITGHVLEAFAAMGYNKSNSRRVRKAIHFLKVKQIDVNSRHAMWKGTWGVNYIYGTSFALIGLLKAGEYKSSPYIQKALNWLQTKQNADGGFGESTLSYDRASWAGKGLSTPSQTAWALLALLEAGIQNQVVEKAVNYLVTEFNKKGKWVDSYAVGTVHYGFPHLDYPAYPYAFPLMALAKYREQK